jgi:hypothetical protein
VEDSAEEAQALVAALLEANGLELLFQVGGGGRKGGFAPVAAPPKLRPDRFGR